MTATYTLHVTPHARLGDPDALERASLVRDGFSWGAFLVPVLWYAWHRHWLAALAALVIVLGFGFLLRSLGVTLGGALLAEVLLHLLNGFEGSSVRRWLYARRGRPAVDLVQADTVEQAEVKSFGRWLAPEREADRGPGLRSTVPPLGWARQPEPVIGLFPDAEGRP